LPVLSCIEQIVRPKARLHRTNLEDRFGEYVKLSELAKHPEAPPRPLT
jgi:hypothetical protein